MELTDNAAAALEAIRQNEGVPEGHGTRLTADERPGGDLAVRLEFVEEVPEGDQVTEQAGTEVYLDPMLSEPLADAVMDVQQGDEGLAFVFRMEPA